MTKLIIVTSENFHKLALAYLILSDFCFFPPKIHFFFQSIELQSCHPIPPLVCLCLLHSPGNSLNWACPVVQWKKFRTKSQANKCAPRPALFLKSYVTLSISFDHSEPVPSAAKWEHWAWWCHLSEVFPMYPPNKCACMCTHTSCIWKTSVSHFYDWYLTYTMSLYLLFFPTSQLEYKFQEYVDFCQLSSLLHSQCLQQCLAYDRYSLC